MKRIKELQGLSEDHHQALVLARRCKNREIKGKSIEADELWEHARTQFSEKLNYHFHLEELHLIPALEAMELKSEASRIKEEHEYLRTLINLTEPDFELINTFGEVLESHVRFEERDVMDKFQDDIPKQDLNELYESWTTLHRDS